MHRARTALVLGVAAALAGTATAAAAPNNNNSQKLRQAVTVDGITEHMAALQAVADANRGNRLSGTPGYDASVMYVADKARAAGLEVEVLPFTHNYTGELSSARLDRISAPAKRFVNRFDHRTMSNSGDGDVTAPLVAVDVKIPSTGGSTSGCEASDFAGFPAGSIALVQRGTCDFSVKIDNAEAAGATGAVVMNEGDTPARMAVAFVNAGPTKQSIPVVFTSFQAGDELRNGATNGATGVSVRVLADWFSGVVQSYNIAAETPGGDPDNVLVVGGHLDSVAPGAGINDNTSGSGTILEIAEQLTKTTPRNKIRFMWFGGEESGLLGSRAYVASLAQPELDRIAAMLNFDMLASRNFVRFVYDGDLSDSTPPPSGAPEGSAQMEELFNDYFAAQGLSTEPTAFDGRSDYGPFIAAGIPAGGLFTGAEVRKSAALAAEYGGAAGERFDPCYHLVCDTLDTLTGVPPAFSLFDPATAPLMAGNGLVGLDQMSDAVAHAVISLAQSTFVVNGQGGKGNFNSDEKLERAADS